MSILFYFEKIDGQTWSTRMIPMTSAFQLQDKYLCLTNLSMISCIVDKPIIAYVPLWKCDLSYPGFCLCYPGFVFKTGAYHVSKDHPRR
jgi:hypothetical protein